MANINVNELTKEQIEKVMTCETVEELIAVAKAEGVELTQEEAEAYLAELADFELDETTLKNAAGGECYFHNRCKDDARPNRWPAPKDCRVR